MMTSPIAPTARELLESLKARDVHLRANGDRLQLDAPQGAFTDSDRVNVALLKPQLLALLTSQPPAHRWNHTTAPDLHTLSQLVTTSQRSQFISPQRELLVAWKSLSEFCGISLTSRHIGMLPTWLHGREHLPEDELLETYISGLLPDDGSGLVWRDPHPLFDEAPAAATARAQSTAMPKAVMP